MAWQQLAVPGLQVQLKNFHVPHHTFLLVGQQIGFPIGHCQATCPAGIRHLSSRLPVLPCTMLGIKGPQSLASLLNLPIQTSACTSRTAAAAKST